MALQNRRFKSALFGFDKEQVEAQILTDSQEYEARLRELDGRVAYLENLNEMLERQFEERKSESLPESVDEKLMDYAFKRAKVLAERLSSDTEREVSEMREITRATGEVLSSLPQDGGALDLAAREALRGTEAIRAALKTPEALDGPFYRLLENHLRLAGTAGEARREAVASQAEDSPEAEKTLGEKSPRRGALRVTSAFWGVDWENIRRADGAEGPAPPDDSAKQNENEKSAPALDRYLEKKVTGADILDESGNVIIPKSTAITGKVVEKARSVGKLPELIVNMTVSDPTV